MVTETLAKQVRQGTGYTEFPSDVPAGTCVVVEYNGAAHLPFYLQPDGKLINTLLTAGVAGGPAEDVIADRPWRIQQ